MECRLRRAVTAGREIVALVGAEDAGDPLEERGGDLRLQACQVLRGYVYLNLDLERVHRPSGGGAAPASATSGVMVSGLHVAWHKREKPSLLMTLSDLEASLPQAFDFSYLFRRQGPIR